MSFSVPVKRSALAICPGCSHWPVPEIEEVLSSGEESETAAPAVDLRQSGAERLGRGTAAAYRQIRSRVRFLEHDRPLTQDIEAVADLIRSGSIMAEVREALEHEEGRAR